jgi:hypothetical protein
MPVNSASSAWSNSALARAARLSWTALAVFVVALAIAAWLYPGGSWTDRQGAGFSLWRNFWCDLVRSQAINGADNGAARRVASGAFGALALALWWFWPVASSLLASAQRALVCRLGRVSTLALLGMVLLPSDAHPILHGVVALVGGGLGMLCAALSSAGRLSEESRWSLRRLSGMAALALAAGNALLYVYVAYGGGPETLAQPGVQKLATFALLLWMSSTLACASGRARSGECERGLSGRKSHSP